MAQTDNSYLADKVALRLDHLPDEPIKVLDCFGGMGKVWQAVKILSAKNISVLPIDIIDYGFHLPGDNKSYLGSMNLEKFNVIDMDAYGIPYEQMKIILDRKYRGIVFVTFIQSVMGQMSYGLLYDIGFTSEMVKKSPVLFGARGWKYFLEWLSSYGITEIWHRSHNRKHYLGFELS